MFRKKHALVILAVVVVLIGASTAWILQRITHPALLPLKSYAGSMVDLGFTFVPVNESTSGIYNLNSSGGSLVTSVDRGSLAAEAGLKAGDLIVGLNGVDLNDNTSLLGLIRGCPQDSRVTLEVRDSTGVRNVVLCSPDQCAPN